MTTLNLESNHVAYLSRLLEGRYHHLQALLVHVHLSDEHAKDTTTEMRVIETIQLVLVPR